MGQRQDGAATAGSVRPAVVASAPAVAALQAGRSGDAESFARAALSARPRESQPLTLLGIALARQGRADEALECFRQAAAEAPGEAGVRTNLALALRQAGRLDEVCLEYAAAVAAAPRSAELHLKLGQTELAAGRAAAALAAFDASLQLEAGRAAHYGRGVALERLGRPEEAAAAFGAAAGHADASIRHIRALLRARRIDAALAAAQAQAAACHDDPSTQELLADCLLAQAEQVLGRLGRLHGAQGDHQAARRSYARPAQIAPSNPLGWSGQGAALTALHEPQAAGATLERALAITPDDPAVLNNLGLTSAAGGAHEQALTWYERGSAAAPHLAEGRTTTMACRCWRWVGTAWRPPPSPAPLRRSRTAPARISTSVSPG
jgi:Flp pilus assembly protein TadD